MQLQVDIYRKREAKHIHLTLTCREDGSKAAKQVERFVFPASAEGYVLYALEDLIEDYELDSPCLWMALRDMEMYYRRIAAGQEPFRPIVTPPWAV